jgi:hypothetical protein
LSGVARGSAAGAGIPMESRQNMTSNLSVSFVYLAIVQRHSTIYKPITWNSVGEEPVEAELLVLYEVAWEERMIGGIYRARALKKRLNQKRDEYIY